MRNLKKVISSVAALAIVASSASAFAVTFPDVDASASYNNAVQTMSALHIIEGDDNGLFNPDNQVTRAEFTKMAVGALGEMAAAEAQTTSQFRDAANSSVHWAAGYVAQGVADGFINGYDDVTFGPDDQVTYAQACKMLVAAVGYTTYAEAAGGWPTGYVSQASSLGITKGVSATNDKALTRAQCATLIYNAMDVPLCVIDTWETTATLTGPIQTPILKKLDGKEGRDYQTLFTDKHNTYVVKGRVTVTPQGNASGLKKDEVRYDVEVSDNFDDAEYGGSVGYNTTDGTFARRTTETFKVGDTSAMNMLFSYTVAVVQKDEDSDEYTILSIENFGNSKEVEVYTDDVADDADNLITNENANDPTKAPFYVGYVKNKKLPVFKSSTSSSTTKYDLAVDGDNIDAVMYVNGVEISGKVTDELINKYIINNPTGTVKLVDKTTVGSTTTDGKYDYLMVSYYVDAVVDYTQETQSKAKVYFKAQQTKATRMEWDPDDEDVDITFTKDGQKIAYTDLNEFDVLSIQYDIANEGTESGSLTDKEYYNVIVSSNVVEGDVTSRDTEEQTITIGGNEYDLVEAMTTTDDYELGTQYKVYVDAFGYIAHFEEGSSDKNYGVIVAMYNGSGDDQPSVRFITSDAKTVSYECKDAGEAKKFYNYAMTRNPDGNATFHEFKKGDIATQIKEGATVCTYKLSGGKVKFDKPYPTTGDPQGGENLEYKANSSKIGSYSISDATTKIIDMDAYMNDDDTTVKTLSVASFEDEAGYTAYFYDKNSDSVYRFAIVFKGTSSIRPETQLAVVKKSNGQKDVDTTTCSSYTVLRGGNEEEMFYDDENASIPEGSVIAYVVGPDGYVEKKADGGNLYILYTPEGSYEDSMGVIRYTNYYDVVNDQKKKAEERENLTFTERTNFVDVVNNTSVDSAYISAKNVDKGAKAIAYKGEGSTSKDVYVYFGLVHKKSASNVELFTKQSSGVSKVSELIDFSTSGASVYAYDYAERSGKGTRLSAGNSGTQSTSVFNQAYTNDKNDVVWNNLDGATPQFAFIKEVDGDVTDAVFYVSK